MTSGGGETVPGSSSPSRMVDLPFSADMPARRHERAAARGTTSTRLMDRVPASRNAQRHEFDADGLAESLRQDDLRDEERTGGEAAPELTGHGLQLP